MSSSRFDQRQLRTKAGRRQDAGNGDGREDGPDGRMDADGTRTEFRRVAKFIYSGISSDVSLHGEEARRRLFIGLEILLRAVVVALKSATERCGRKRARTRSWPISRTYRTERCASKVYTFYPELPGNLLRPPSVPPLVPTRSTGSNHVGLTFPRR